MSRPWLAAVLVLAALAAAPAPAKDYEVEIVRFILHKPFLVDARGVVGPLQSYEFQGTWSLSRLMWEDQVSYLKGQHLDERGVLVYLPRDSKTYKGGVYLGKASWDRKTGEFKEKLDLINSMKLSEAKKNYFGSRTVKGKCTTDPFLGPGLCEDFQRQWSIPSWDGKPGPIGLGLEHDSKWAAAWRAFALAEAQALSQMHKDEAPPPPPPPQAQQDKKSGKADVPATQSVKPGAPVPPAASASAQEQASERSFSPGDPVAAPSPPSARTDIPPTRTRQQAEPGPAAGASADALKIRQAAEPWSHCLRNAFRQGTEVQACDPAFQEWIGSAGTAGDSNILETLYLVFRESVKEAKEDLKNLLAKVKDPEKVEQALTGYLRQLDSTALRMARRSGTAESRQQLGTLQAQRSREAREEIRSLVTALPGAAPAAQISGAAVGRPPQRSAGAGAPAQVPPEPDWNAKRGTPVEAGRAAPSQSSRQQSASSPITIEAEALVKAGKASVNSGGVTVQAMAGFGSGWSGNAQLFWTGGKVGAVLDLVIDVPAPGTYGVELYLTRAPDYGDVKIEVDGKPVAALFNGYAAKVSPGGPLMVGRFPLQPGPRKVSFMIVGKDRQSTGYFAGIDQVKLYPVGGP
ncbi:MAG TPA: hypothetical protein VF859_13020 [Burkholderiales bacterium]